ncbi:MAG TPA: sigma-70 family RNA polymerase sigma factor [Thermoanaerobaculia bacterium]|nr:sigma-70 family RNA polymerase sigma factor [Thermoanaerobaculia bacterium]
MTDAELVTKALAGSQRAFRELLARFERPVYGLIVRMVREPAVAEELAQDVFVKAFRSLETYDPQRKLSSWLFKIAHNATVDHLRRGAVDTVPLQSGGDDGGDLAAVLADGAAESPEAAAERHEMARALERAIARLRPEYREAVVLRYQEGLSYEEISDAMELPIGTIKTNLHRARKEMAVAMAALGWGPGEGDRPQPAERAETIRLETS